MWISPNHPNPPRQLQAEPPTEQGQRLVTCVRPGRRGEPDAELRVCLDKFEGHAYLSLRVWQEDADGAWWPTKRGVSVRLSEAHAVAMALLSALDQARTERPATAACATARRRPTGPLAPRLPMHAPDARLPWSESLPPPTARMTDPADLEAL